MTKVFLAIVLVAALGLSNSALARPTCWPSDNAVNHFVKLDPFSVQELPVKDLGYSAEESRTVLKVIPKEGGYAFSMKFRDSFPDFGHPQNVFALMILDEFGAPVFFEDFTGSCKSPGLSFFPRQDLNLFFLKSSQSTPDKLHILLWSR